MSDITILPKPVPIPEPIPEPVVKQIRVICKSCKGTGVISLTNGPLPATDAPCATCAGSGKLVWGEMDA
jgi:DnaJ-class molecular chaperone